MNKKGLIGAIKYTALIGAIVFAMFILVSGLNVFAYGNPDAGSPVIFYTINQSVASGAQYTYPNVYGFQINVSNGSTSADVKNCTFYANFSGAWTNYTDLTTPAIENSSSSINMINPDGSVGNTTTFKINFTTDRFYGAGTYYYAWACNGTDNKWNYTNNKTLGADQWTNPYVIAPNTSTSSWMTLAINATTTTNGTAANFTKSYSPDSINVTANYTTTAFTGQNINFNFYRNTTTNLTASSLNNESDIWATGTVWYDYNTSGNTNYSVAAKHFHINITQNASTATYLNLTLDSYQTKIRNQGNYNGATYPNATNITGNINNSAVDFAEQTITAILYRNVTAIGTSNGVNDTTSLGAGVWNYTYYTAGNTNFSAATLQYNVTIAQNTTYKFDLYINGSSQDTTGLVGQTYAMSGNLSSIFTSAQNVTLLLYYTAYNFSNPDGVAGSTFIGFTNATGTGANTLLYPSVYTGGIAGRFNFTLNTSGNTNYSANASGISYNLTFYGYANVTCTYSVQPRDTFTTPVSQALTTTCRAFDTSTGNVIPGYPITYLNATGVNNTIITYSILASNITDITTGTGTQTTPGKYFSAEGTYQFIANITNNTSGFYHASSVLNAAKWLYVTALSNPRPIIVNDTSVAVNFINVSAANNPHGNWSQLRGNYSFEGIMVYPNYSTGIFTGMVMPTNQYAPLSFSNANFWEFPSRQEFLSYNLTFTVNFTATAKYQQINVSVPIPSGGFESNPLYRNQTLLPATWTTVSPMISSMMNGTTAPTMTVLMKNPGNFSITIYNVTNASGAVSNTITLTNCGFNSTDTGSCPNATFVNGKLLLNLSGSAGTTYVVSMMFGLQDDTCIQQAMTAGGGSFNDTLFRQYCQQNFGPPKSESSPVFIVSQSVVGLNPFATLSSSAPVLNTSGTTTFVLNVTNTLLNYTANNVLIEYKVPINMTGINGSISVESTMNMSSGHSIGYYNTTTSLWETVSNLTTYVYNTTFVYVNTTEACYNMTDNMGGSPTKGKNVEMCFKSYVVNLAQPRIAGSNGWSYLDQCKLNLSMTLTNGILNKTQNITGGTNMGDPGSSQDYSMTIGGSQGMFVINNTLLPNITGAAGSSACRAGTGPGTGCDNISVWINGQLYQNWTAGSVVINSQSSGVQSVTVRYAVPATGVATTTTTTTTPGTGFTTSPTDQTVAISQIPAGETKPMTFTKEELGVSTVDITAKNLLTNIELKIGTVATLPSTVSVATGEVYKYLQFTPTRISEADLTSAKIRFKVTKSWLTNNNINPDTVALSRWTTQWNKLPTVKASEDSTYVYYDATTTGFSYFVITAQKFATAAPSQNETAETNVTGGEETTGGTNWPLIGGIFVVAIALIAGIYVYFNYFKKGYPGYKSRKNVF